MNGDEGTSGVRKPRLYIGTFTEKASEADIRRFFSAYKVEGITFLIMPIMNRFALVTLEIATEAEKACAELPHTSELAARKISGSGFMSREKLL